MKRLTLFAILSVLIASCGGAGSLETQNIDIPYPQADTVTLNLDTTAGQVTVSAGDTTGVKGTLTTNVGAWHATTDSSGSSITIQQGRSSADVIPAAQNTWDLQVGKDKPLILNHTNTTADTTFNLGGLELTQVNATATTGNYTVRYASSTPAGDGGTATFQSSNGNIDAAGLLNSNLSSLVVTTSGGNIQLGFDGAGLTQDMNIRLNSQTGDVLLRIPRTVPAQNHLPYQQRCGVGSRSAVHRNQFNYLYRWGL